MLGCINIGKQTNNKEEEKFSGRSGKTVVRNSHFRRVPNQIGVLHFYSHKNINPDETPAVVEAGEPGTSEKTYSAIARIRHIAMNLDLLLTPFNASFAG